MSAGSSTSVCASIDTCEPVVPDSPNPGTPSPPAELYDLTNIDRVASNLYKADSGSTQLLLETRLCLALTLRDDGFLVRENSGAAFEIYIDNSSADVCEVVGIYVAAPPFGTYELSGIQNVASDIFRAQSGLVDIMIETQFCFEYPASNNGVLEWALVGSQLFIDDFSTSICNVVNVYAE